MILPSLSPLVATPSFVTCDGHFVLKSDTQGRDRLLVST
jgi:hypothetical protein